mmetsp:Transcript_42293/g.75759  ORF Transcript_42293/g.75759 Transcript_42293/m.75759 type:complete len:84 (+) Transcript_42293:1491-1742(+)
MVPENFNTHGSVHELLVTGFIQPASDNTLVPAMMEYKRICISRKYHMLSEVWLHIVDKFVLCVRQCVWTKYSEIGWFVYLEDI